MKPVVLDMFCGIGGWSIGFYREGFECIGVDIVDVGYPYDLRIADLNYCMPVMQHPDVIIASPPCTEFSTLTQLSYKKGQRDAPDPEKGLKLVRQTKHWIEEIKPRYWIVENVVGSIPHIETVFGKPMMVAKPYVLWGNLPPKMFEFQPLRTKDAKISHTWEHAGKGGNVLGKGGGRIGLPEDFPFDPLRSWKRARIPVWLAQSIAKQCREELEQELAQIAA